ncbi:MAG: prolyl-tRNA synthetase associated domain-containing protein [Clostridia bacterium]|nr:prolyl-tRNA synthetase associated domain-containing protein [Clostridia bacterium]MBR4185813.1 prolyl-tRNA synthetase associated domain-containing protein [Clostridia bacterium]
MILYHGRPGSADGRLPREMRVYDALDALGIPYERIDHAPADTMEVCRAIDDALGTLICKNLFLCNRQKTKFFLLMMPGDKVFKTKELTPQIGAGRLSFGEPGDLLRLLDTLPGAVSVMGLLNDPEGRVSLLVDEDVLAGETLGCHPCVSTSSLKLRTADVFGRFVPSTGHRYLTVRLDGAD